MGNASALAGFLLLLGVATTPVDWSARTEGAYSRLSAGNQKIALALFDAGAPDAERQQRDHGRRAEQQRHDGSSTATTATKPAAKPMTLDQIATQKQGGHAWGEICGRSGNWSRPGKEPRTGGQRVATQCCRGCGQGQVAGGEVELK